jgi:hypothetical protein
VDYLLKSFLVYKSSYDTMKTRTYINESLRWKLVYMNIDRYTYAYEKHLEFSHHQNMKKMELIGWPNI